MSEISILNQVEQEIKSRNISDDEISQILSSMPQFTNRRIISGYASVNVTDREGQRIPIKTLKDTLPQFMGDLHYRNITVFHSDVVIGRVLPKWTHPETSKIWETKVDDKGLFIVPEIRYDIEIADKVWGEIEKGNL